MTRLIGIVERADGQIVLVEPEQIQFMDGFSARIIRRFYGRDEDEKAKEKQD